LPQGTRFVERYRESKTLVDSLFIHWQCNQEGHMARECPNAPVGGGNNACRKVKSKDSSI